MESHVEGIWVPELSLIAVALEAGSLPEPGDPWVTL